MTRFGAVLVALFCASALAADSEDIAFLEFLGSFSDDDGGWLDPLSLEQAVADAEATAASNTDPQARAPKTQDEDPDDDDQT